jgi:hypothetical protein
MSLVLRSDCTYCGKACRKNELTPAQFRLGSRRLFELLIAATSKMGVSSTAAIGERCMVVEGTSLVVFGENNPRVVNRE